MTNWQEMDGDSIKQNMMLQMMKRRIANGFNNGSSKTVSLGKLISPMHYRKRSKDLSIGELNSSRHQDNEQLSCSKSKSNKTSNSKSSSRIGIRLAKHKLQAEDIDNLLF